MHDPLRRSVPYLAAALLVGLVLPLLDASGLAAVPGPGDSGSVPAVAALADRSPGDSGSVPAVAALPDRSPGAPGATAPEPVRSHRDPSAGSDALPFVPPVPVDTADAPPIVVEGRGWGHSVGMSQYGASAMAAAGHDHAAILAHYYPGTNLASHRAADRDIHTNLFLNKPSIDATVLALQTAPGSAQAITVEVGDGQAHAVAGREIWALRRDVAAGEFVLSDAAGAERARGEGPVRVRFGAGDDVPRLRLPQLADGAEPLSGTYRWGTLRVTADEAGNLRPILVQPVEVYLRGLAEMPSSWHVEALAAQAIAGRGYAIRRVVQGLDPDCDCHLGTTPHDQHYAGWLQEAGYRGDAWVRAVEMTKGRVLAYKGELAWTYYSSSHAGRTEASGDSWAYPETLPYLPSVEDPWSLDPGVKNPMRAWTREIPNAEFAHAVGLARVDAVEILDRTDGGSPRTIAVRGITWDGREVAYDFRGWRKGIAASDLKLALRSALPSQQISSITIGE